jgi:hypothetical protein
MQVDGQTPDQPSPSQPNSEFRDFVGRFERLSDEDEDDDDALPSISMLTYRRISIQDLFDFSNSKWQALFALTVHHSFDAELAIYDLLDLDAAGDEDVDLNIDESTGEMLSAS